MTVDEVCGEATEATDVGQYLYEASKQLLDEGVPRESIVAGLKGLYVWFGEQGREADQDAVVDVVDSLVGWSSPGARPQG